jgi:hypothetical protein
MAEKDKIRLTTEHKLFLIEHLATFHSLSEVGDLFVEQFGFEISRQLIWRHDASKLSNESHIAPKFKELFKAIRTRFLADCSQVPIANKVVRLQRLEHIYHCLQRVDAKAEVLEQAAKEMGDFFTNRREVTGAGGGPIAVDAPGPDLSKLSKEQLAQQLAISEAAYGCSTPEPSKS